MAKLTNELIEELAADTSKIAVVIQHHSCTYIRAVNGVSFNISEQYNPDKLCAHNLEVELGNESIQKSLRILRCLSEEVHVVKNVELTEDLINELTQDPTKIVELRRHSGFTYIRIQSGLEFHISRKYYSDTHCAYPVGKPIAGVNIEYALRTLQRLDENTDKEQWKMPDEEDEK